jgi:hypothetical protein
VYTDDLYAPEWNDGLVTLTGGNTISGLLTSSSIPVWNSGLVARPTSDNGVYEHVLKFAGARPYDRDSVDKRVIASVHTRTGQIINCVSANGSSRCSKNAGGWPTYAHNRRTLTLPANPSTIGSSGYSNLELWLQSMDKSLGGLVQSTSPTSPAALSVN